MQARELGALLLLAALRGSLFLFIKGAVLVLAPFVLMELRMGLAALAWPLSASRCLACRRSGRAGRSS